MALLNQSHSTYFGLFDHIWWWAEAKICSVINKINCLAWTEYFYYTIIKPCGAAVQQFLISHTHNRANNIKIWQSILERKSLGGRPQLIFTIHAMTWTWKAKLGNSLLSSTDPACQSGWCHSPIHCNLSSPDCCRFLRTRSIMLACVTNRQNVIAASFAIQLSPHLPQHVLAKCHLRQ
jgi:hypothetical protein